MGRVELPSRVYESLVLTVELHRQMRSNGSLLTLFPNAGDERFLLHRQWQKDTTFLPSRQYSLTFFPQSEYAPPFQYLQGNQLVSTTVAQPPQ